MSGHKSGTFATEESRNDHIQIQAQFSQETFRETKQL
jgi:hypothetical protein